MRRSEGGWVLAAVMTAMALVLLTMLVALTVAQNAGKLVNLQLTYQGQATNVAQAGAVDALDWFRRQTTQPVTSFDSPGGPLLNPGATPPINDTDIQTDPPRKRSIQRDFEISQRGKIWGHYEVVSDTASSNNNPASTGLMDLSLQRGKAGPGQIWQIGSRGVIYVRNNMSRDVNGVFVIPWNQAPNHTLAIKEVRTEIARLVYNPPSTVSPVNSVNSALYIPNAANAVVAPAAAPRARVLGGAGYAIAAQTGTPPAANAPGGYGGSPETINGLSANSFRIPDIFGVTQNELFGMANIYVTDPLDLPNNNANNQLPGMQLVVINAGTGNNVVFNNTSPNRGLRGSGILVVIGNLDIGGNSSWNGVIYVNGNYIQRDPATVSGSVILRGTNSPNFNNSTASIQGVGDFTDLVFDSFIVNQMRQQMIGYRFARPMYYPCPTPTTGDCAP
jgi:hypothetical protein